MSDADTLLAEQPWHKAIFTRQMLLVMAQTMRHAMKNIRRKGTMTRG